MKYVLGFFKTIAKSFVYSFMFILFLIIFTSGVVSFMTQKPKKIVKQDSFLNLSFANDLSESPQVKPSILEMEKFLSQEKPLLFFNLLKSLDNAMDDSRIKGIILDLDNWNLSSEHSAEVIQKLESFKQTNKPIYAYGNNLSLNNYRVAVLANKIVMPPTASAGINLTGYGIGINYYKNLGDKLGIKMNVIHIGDYKTAGENFAKSNMTKEFKEDIEKLLNERYDNFISFVSQKRLIDDFGKNMFAGNYALLTPFKAIEKKLIDQTQYYDEFKDNISEGNEFKSISISDYAMAVDKKHKMSDNKIAIVFAEGEIAMDNSPSLLGNGKKLIPSEIIKILEKVEDDKSIKGLVLRVNSPGGSALASDIIAHKLDKIRAKMPIFVSMGNVAASGGYMISCGASKIFAEKSTITGSIGVVSMIPQVAALMKKLGVNREVISKGKFSNLFDLTRDMGIEEKELLRQSMLAIYHEFKSRVSEGRKIDIEKLENYAGGRIWTGMQAKTIGLTDDIGTLYDTIGSLSKELNIADNYEIVTFQRQKTALEQIMSVDFKNMQESFFGLSKEEFVLNNLKKIKAYVKKPMLLFPYTQAIL